MQNIYESYGYIKKYILKDQRNNKIKSLLNE